MPKLYHKRFAIVQEIVNQETHIQFLKVTNPSILIDYCPGCEVCESIVQWFQKTYDNLEEEEDKTNLQMHESPSHWEKDPHFGMKEGPHGPNPRWLQQWKDAVQKKKKDQIQEYMDQSKFRKHYHSEMVTLCHEDYPISLDLDLPDLPLLETRRGEEKFKEMVQRSITKSLNKRFPKTTVIQESAKQKQFRTYVQEEVDWDKQNNGGFLIALGKGEGKTICSSNALDYNPPQVAWIVVFKSLISQTYREFTLSCAQVSDVVTQYNVISYEKMMTLVDENPSLFATPGTFVDFDEFSQFFRTLTANRLPLLVASLEASFRIGKSGSFIMSGLKDLRSVSLFLNVNLDKVIQQDKLRQEEALKKKKTDIRHPGYVQLKEKRQTFQEERLASASVTTSVNGICALSGSLSKSKKKLKPKDEEKGDEGGEDEGDTSDEFTHFIPSPVFFEELRQKMKGRVLYGSKLRDQEIEEDMRRTYDCSSLKRKREETKEEETHPSTKKKKTKHQMSESEKRFPTIERRVERIPMSWSQVYVYMKNRHAVFCIAGEKFEDTKGNNWETKTQRICNTFDTVTFSPIEQTYRWLSSLAQSGRLSKEHSFFFSQMDFSPPSPSISCPKYYFCVKEMLKQESYPFTIFSPYLRDGLFYLMRLVREISPQYKFPALTRTEDELKELLERKKGLLPNTLKRSHPSVIPSAFQSELQMDKQAENQLPQIAYLETILAEDLKQLKKIKAKQKAIKQKEKEKEKKRQTETEEQEDEDNNEEEEEELKLMEENNQKNIRSRPLRTLCWTGKESTESRHRIQTLFLKQGLDVAGLSKASESGVDLPNGKGCIITSPMPLMDSNEQALSRTIRMNSEHPVIKTMIAMSSFPDYNAPISKEDLACLKRMWACETLELDVDEVVETQVLPELRQLVKKVKKTVEECIYEKSLLIAEENKPVVAMLEMCDPVASTTTFSQYLYQTLTHQPERNYWIQQWEKENQQKYSSPPDIVQVQAPKKKQKEQGIKPLSTKSKSIFEDLFH